MKHEPRCIYPVTCTCVSILREQLRVAENYLAIATQKLNVTYEALKDTQKRLAKVEADKASNDADYLKCAAERNSMERKIEDGLSCCCSGCARHNQDIQIAKSPEPMDI